MKILTRTSGAAPSRVLFASLSLGLAFASACSAAGDKGTPPPSAPPVTSAATTAAPGTTSDPATTAAASASPSPPANAARTAKVEALCKHLVGLVKVALPPDAQADCVKDYGRMKDDAQLECTSRCALGSSDIALARECGGFCAMPSFMCGSFPAEKKTACETWQSKLLEKGTTKDFTCIWKCEAGHPMTMEAILDCREKTCPL